MATRREPQETRRPRRPPATTPEGYENRVIAKAMRLAESQIDEGTVSAQVLSHYLKLGSSREKLEQERLAKEVELLEIKKETMASAARVEELFEEAIAAMRRYKGESD